MLECRRGTGIPDHASSRTAGAEGHRDALLRPVQHTTFFPRSVVMTTPTSATKSASYTGSVSIRGRFLWHELLARDVDAALAFYPGVAGWTSVEMPFPGQKEVYRMFLTAG